jgi:uncharacterized RDD family membrane protein YckC
MVEKQLDYTSSKTVTVVGFGRRLLSTLIDGALVSFMVFIVMTIIGFGVLLLTGFYPDEGLPVDILVMLSGLIVSIAYYVVSWAKSGQTLGKSVTGMKVVRTDGSRLSWGQALLRYLGYIVSAVVFSLGFLWVAFDPKRQGWHDKIARTYVVDAETTPWTGRADFVPSDPGRNWIWLAIWIVLALVMPGVLLTSLLILGPVVSRLFTNFLSYVSLVKRH